MNNPSFSLPFFYPSQFSGHFGHVFRAQLNDPLTGQVVPAAVKSLKPSPNATSLHTIEQFLREASIMRRLCHRNVRFAFPLTLHHLWSSSSCPSSLIQILRIYGVCFGEDGPLPSMIMPFMHFGDLRTFVSDSFRACFPQKYKYWN
jgi:serine/threonine protein kinase